MDILDLIGPLFITLLVTFFFSHALKECKNDTTKKVNIRKWCIYGYRFIHIAIFIVALIVFITSLVLMLGITDIDVAGGVARLLFFIFAILSGIVVLRYCYVFLNQRKNEKD